MYDIRIEETVLFRTPISGKPVVRAFWSRFCHAPPEGTEQRARRGLRQGTEYLWRVAASL